MDSAENSAAITWEEEAATYLGQFEGTHQGAGAAEWGAAGGKDVELGTPSGICFAEKNIQAKH